MPRTYSNERRSELTAATRARILDAVRKLIVEVGLDAVTLQAVAERADVALRTLYNHFGSRAELLSAALVDLACQIGDVSMEGWQAHPSQPRESLRSYLAGVYDVYGQLQPWFDVLLNARGDPELDKTVQALRSGGRKHIAEMLTTAAEQGILRVPFDSAVTLVSVHTLFPTWRYVTSELGLSSEQAKLQVIGYLDAVLFDAPFESPR